MYSEEVVELNGLVELPMVELTDADCVLTELMYKRQSLTPVYAIIPLVLHVKHSTILFLYVTMVTVFILLKVPTFHCRDLYILQY